MKSARLLGSLFPSPFLGLVLGALAACQGPPGDDAGPAAGGPPTVHEVYVRALTEIGPHRYPDVFIPAVVLGTPPAPLIQPAVMLVQPWAATAHPTARPAQPTAAPAPARARSRPPSTRPASRPARPAPAPATPETAERGADDATGGFVNELRFGALKHAVAFGHTAKETGMDANVEALFQSPGWLDLVWSPRPHLGATLNASTSNTDFVYSGLTWEWAPAWGLFVDFGFGLSIHDGMLDNSQIEGKSRLDRREFGCRVLFRESVELGTRFWDRHGLSLMWAHHSHGSLCNEENEGIDNAGLRYGYRL